MCNTVSIKYIHFDTVLIVVILKIQSQVFKYQNNQCTFKSNNTSFIIWYFSYILCTCCNRNKLFYSIPKVFVSSTANKSFSYKISGVGYGGRSKRLKHV